MYPTWPSDKPDEPFDWDDTDDAVGFDVEAPQPRSNSTDNRSNQAAEKIKEALLEIYTASEKKNTNVTDWKDKAKNVFCETQHIYGQKGKSGKKETELITELCWLMWEVKEKIGEFAVKSDIKLKEAVEKNAGELALKIDNLYNTRASQTHPLEHIHRIGGGGRRSRK